MIGQDGFDHVLADRVSKAGTDERFRHLAGAEAGDAGGLLIALDDLLKAAGDLIGGQLDLDFAGALGVERGAVSVRVVVALMIVSLVVVIMVVEGFAFSGQGGYVGFGFGIGGRFDGFS